MKIIFIGLALFAVGLEVDIVSSFNIEELPTKFLKLKQEFNVNRTCPVDYLVKSADSDSLKKIVVFDPVFGGGEKIFSSLPKEKLILFNWEPKFYPLELYEAY